MTLRVTLFALCTFLLSPLDADAQDPPDPTHVYEAYYRVNPADLGEWNRMYQQDSVPALTELQNEGLIEGWGQWQHSTGGDYNIRLTVRTTDWNSLWFWDEYLSRVQERQTEAEWIAARRMIQAHHDEIWSIQAVNVPADAEVAYLYASTFQVNLADMEEWDRLRTEVTIPMLNEMMEDGLLAGWVHLGHNTGGPHNSKFLYLFEEWDDIDGAFESLQERFAEGYAEDLDRIYRLRLAHDDIIWIPTPE